LYIRYSESAAAAMAQRKAAAALAQKASRPASKAAVARLIERDHAVMKRQKIRASLLPGGFLADWCLILLVISGFDAVIMPLRI
jgi:hypothetical protein